MTNEKSHEVQVHPIPRRRLRKRWIFVAAIFGFLWLAGWLVFRERSLAVLRLPNGQRFTVHKLTYGTDHCYWGTPTPLTAVENWANSWLSRIGRQIDAMNPTGTFRTEVPTLVLWHTFDWKQKDSNSMPHWYVLTDQNGWRTAISTNWLLNTPPSAPAGPGQPVTPQWSSSVLPSPSPFLQFDLLNAQGDRLGGSRLKYEVPLSLIQSWNIQTFPATEKVGNMTVTLNGLHAEWAERDATKPVVDDVIKVTPDFTVTVDGTATTRWQPFTEGAPFLDYPWKPTNPANGTIESVLGTRARFHHCTVSPYDKAWKVYLPLICKNPDDFGAPDRVTIEGVSFENGLPSDPNGTAPVKIGGSTVKFLGAGRAGSFEYEGLGEAVYPIPGVQKLEDWSVHRLEGTFQLAQVPDPLGNVPNSFSLGPGGNRTQYPMTVNLKFTAPRPHFVISLTESGDRFPFVIAKDDNGQEIEGELINVQGLLIWLAKKPCDEIQSVNVTLLLQVPRHFTFVVPPPAVPTRK